MLAPVHEDLPVGMNVALVEDEHVRRRLHDPPRIRRPPRHPRRQAIRLRIVLRLPSLHQVRRPLQRHHRFARLEPARDVAIVAPAADPHARKVRPPVRELRSRPRRRRLLLLIQPNIDRRLLRREHPQSNDQCQANVTCRFHKQKENSTCAHPETQSCSRSQTSCRPEPAVP